MWENMKGLLALPDDPNQRAAAKQGLLGFGAALLGGRGDFGGILGDGLMAGAQGYQSTIQQQQKDQLEQAQLRLFQNKDRREQEKSSFFASAFGTGQDGTASGAGGSFARSITDGGSAATDEIPPLSGVPMMSIPGARMPPPIDWSKVPRKGEQGPESQQDAAPRGAARFPFNLQQVTAMKAMGIADLTAEYKLANEGFKREQGATYELPDGTTRSYARLDPGQVQNQDGTIGNVPGYLDAVSATEGAKARAVEEARANYDLLDPAKYIGEDGRPIGGTRGGYIRSLRELPRKGERPATPAPLRGRAPTKFPTVSAEEQLGRDADRLHILRTELAATTDPRDRAALEREIAGVTRTAGRSAVAGGGAAGGVRLQSPAEARAQVGAIDTNVKAGQDLNSNWIKETHNPVQAEGKAARATLGQLATLQNIDFKSGWGAQTRAAASAMLGALGIKDAGRYATSAQQFQQVAMERNMTMLQAQTGPQTDGDSERAQQTFVRLANTPEANRYIADLTGANARIALRKAEYYNKALPLARERGDLTEIDRRWSAIAPSVWDDPALQKYKVK